MNTRRRARWRLAAALAAPLLGWACGADATSPRLDDAIPARVRLVLGDTQFAAVAMPVRVAPMVEVLNARGQPLTGVTVSFKVVAGDGWAASASALTDATGRAATAWYLGPTPGSAQRLRALVGSDLDTTFSASALPLAADSTYRGRDDFIEFTAGELPVIISAPHGGSLAPAAIPDRTSGETVTDLNTLELAQTVAAVLEQRTGKRPHLVLCRLSRRKLDANRDLAEAAEGNAQAERAWREWHGFLEAARVAVTGSGTGLYIDLHGHGHAIARLELGYLLSAGELALGDVQLNALTARSSIRALASRSPLGLAALLHGPQSLGTLLEARGFAAVPSQSQPAPGSNPFFTGGYNTVRYGSAGGGALDGVQIETHRVGVRDTDENRLRFAQALAAALEVYFESHYGKSL